MYELCIKLKLIKELYYDAQPNKSQDRGVVLVPYCTSVRYTTRYCSLPILPVLFVMWFMSLLLCSLLYVWYDIFINCNWVVTWWQRTLWNSCECWQMSDIISLKSKLIWIMWKV